MDKLGIGNSGREFAGIKSDGGGAGQWFSTNCVVPQADKPDSRSKLVSFRDFDDTNFDFIGSLL